MACWCNTSLVGHAPVLSALMGHPIVEGENGSLLVFRLIQSQAPAEPLLEARLEAEISVAWPWSGGAGPQEADAYQDLVAHAVARVLSLDLPPGIEGWDEDQVAKHTTVVRSYSQLRAAAAGCAPPEQLDEFLSALWWKREDGVWQGQSSPLDCWTRGEQQRVQERLAMARDKGGWPACDAETPFAGRAPSG